MASFGVISGWKYGEKEVVAVRRKFAAAALSRERNPATVNKKKRNTLVL